MGQGFTGLMGAAGAAQGLETLLTRQMVARKQAEIQRAAQIEEAQRAQQLAESSAIRRQQQEGLTVDRQARDADRDTTMAISLANALPIGSALDAPAKARLSGAGFGGLVKEVEPGRFV